MNLFRTILTEAAPQGASMDSLGTMLDALLWVMLIAYGGYVLYTAIRLRRTYMLFPNKFLYPGNCSMETCVDEDGFIDYILPRLTAWGIAMLIMGVLMFLNTYVLRYVSVWIDIATIVLPVGSFVWYIIIQRKAAKLFW